MILLDTCVLLWLAIEPKSLSAKAREAIAAAGEFAHVSSISAWEIAWKERVGKLRLKLPVAAWFPLAIRQHVLSELPITSVIALRSAALPPLHRDPADRFLIATAQEYELTFLTPDPEIQKYPNLKTLW